jgi:hypothetical protein
VTTVKLPPELRAKTPRPLSELALGETGYVSVRALIVSLDQDCFLDATGAIEKPGLMQMTVRRDEEGFHVVLPSAPEFTAEEIVKGMDVLPIASIAVSKDRWSPGRESQVREVSWPDLDVGLSRRAS